MIEERDAQGPRPLPPKPPKYTDGMILITQPFVAPTSAGPCTIRVGASKVRCNSTDTKRLDMPEGSSLVACGWHRQLYRLEDPRGE